MAFLIMPVGLKTNETISKNNTAQLADIVYTDSGPITIGAFTPYELWTDEGNGTAAFPFVFEYLSIDLNIDEAPACIEIRGNSSYVTIKNCLFNSKIVGYLGVYLEDASNIVIENCIFNNSFQAIGLLNSDSITIRGNTMLGDTVREGNFRGEGVHIDDCSNIVMEKNTIVKKAKAIVTRNFMTGIVDGNNVTNNYFGICIYTNTSYVNVTTNTCKLNYRGIGLATADHIRAEKNILEKNTLAGIVLATDATNVTLSSNTFISNGVIGAPLAEESSGYGLLIQSGSTSNSVTDNDFFDNVCNGFDDMIGNFYNNNYWSDYLGYGDTPYTVAGDAGNIDYNPRGPNTGITTTSTTTTTTNPTTTIQAADYTVAIVVGVSVLAGIIFSAFVIKRR